MKRNKNNKKKRNNENNFLRTCKLKNRKEKEKKFFIKAYEFWPLFLWKRCKLCFVKMEVIILQSKKKTCLLSSK